MELKTILREQIERECTYANDQEVGTEEYNASLKRLSDLENKLIEIEKIESEAARRDEQTQDERKDRRVRNIFEGIKIGSSILVPMVGLVCITAFEKDSTFTSALKGYVNLFIPKKL